MSEKCTHQVWEVLNTNKIVPKKGIPKSLLRGCVIFKYSGEATPKVIMKQIMKQYYFRTLHLKWTVLGVFAFEAPSMDIH